jgi:hypothetical protein
LPSVATLDVIHAGAETFLMSDGIRAVALGKVWKDLRPLGPG